MHHITAAKLVGQDSCQALPARGGAGGWSLQWSHTGPTWGQDSSKNHCCSLFFPFSFLVMWVIPHPKSPILDILGSVGFKPFNGWFLVVLLFYISWHILTYLDPPTTMATKWRYIAGTKSPRDSARLRCLEAVSTPGRRVLDVWRQETSLKTIP